MLLHSLKTLSAWLGRRLCNHSNRDIGLLASQMPLNGQSLGGGASHYTFVEPSEPLGFKNCLHAVSKPVVLVHSTKCCAGLFKALNLQNDILP